MDNQRFTTGQVVYRQGDVSRYAYLIVSGEVRLAMEQEGVEYDLARLGSGEVFGEMALLGGGQRSVTAIANEDTTLLAIGEEEFLDMMGELSDTARDLIEALMQRLRVMNQRYAKASASERAEREV